MTIEEQVYELKKENELNKKIIQEMAEFIDKVDEKNLHCIGYFCTVATTLYPEEKRKEICVNCIKNIFKERVQEYEKEN